MIVHFDKAFLKSVQKINNQKLKNQVLQVIEELENAQTLSEVGSVKKLVGFKKYYRLRLGQYRLGLEKNDEATVTLITLAHRKDIYKVFP